MRDRNADARGSFLRGGCLVAALAWSLGACTDSPTGSAGAVPAELLVSQTSVHLASLGESFELTARVMDEHGQEMSGVPLVWTSSDPTVLEHEGGSRFRSRSNGSVSVGVAISDSYPAVGPDGYSANRIRASISVDVVQVPVSLGLGNDLVAGPGTGDIVLWTLGDWTDLFAWSVDANGYPVDAVTGGLTWVADDPGISAVEADGRIVANGSGSTRVVASAVGLSGFVVIQVRASQDITACASVSGQGDSSCGQESLTFAREGY